MSLYLQISQLNLPPGIVGVAYPSVTEAAFGGTPSYTWGVTGPPGGLSLSSGGVWSGTPTTAGVYPIVVTVSDSSGTIVAAQQSITIYATSTLSITTSSLPNGAIGVVYYQVLQATSGTGVGYVWSLNSGTLPNGLTINTAGIIQGTPVAGSSGTVSIVVQVQDSNNNLATATLSLTIAGPLTILTSSLPVATNSVAYTTTLTGTGGSGSGYTWTVTVGSLPTGLSISGSTITGTPTGGAGTSSFTLQLEDSATNITTWATILTVIVLSGAGLTMYDLSQITLTVEQTSVTLAIPG